MLTVTIENGDENSKEFWVNDLGDLKLVQGAITDEFQKVLAQDKSEEKIELERLIEASPCNDVEELTDWIDKMADFEDELSRTNYSCIGDLVDEYDRMQSALSYVYYLVRDFN